MRAAATKAAEAIVNTAIARWAGSSRQADSNNQVAVTALEQMGYTSRAAIEAVERMAVASRQPIKLLATPVGVSTASVQIGSRENGALPITLVEKRAIDQAAEAQIGLERRVMVVITELDLLTHHCKVSFASDPDARRIFGVITDPVVEIPNNPYSRAFDAQTPIEVVAKPRYIGDEIDRMYISNTVLGTES